ncbi:MAG: hypothetical protein J6X02_01580 [Bacilli bacterium]|nr:hypothetical protein [Bacilli bacterium]
MRLLDVASPEYPLLGSNPEDGTWLTLAILALIIAIVVIVVVVNKNSKKEEKKEEK